MNTKDSITDISNKLMLMLQPKKLNLDELTPEYIESLGTGFCDKLDEGQDTIVTPYVHEAFRKQSERETARRANEVHVYDLVNCPRKQAYRKLDPAPLTSREEMYFMRGKAIEYVIKDLLVKEYPDKFGETDMKDYKGIKFGVDVHRKDLNVPIELKSSTTPAAGLAKWGPSATYIDQLKSYIAITGNHIGLLYYFLVAEKDMEHLTGIKPEWIHIYVVAMTKREREQHLYRLEQLAQGLLVAIETKRPELAYGVYDDPRLNFQCQWCSYANSQQCDLGLDSRLKQTAAKKQRMVDYRAKKKGAPKVD